MAEQSTLPGPHAQLRAFCRSVSDALVEAIHQVPFALVMFAPVITSTLPGFLSGKNSPQFLSDSMPGFLFSLNNENM